MHTYSFNNLYITRFIAAIGVVLMHFYDQAAPVSQVFFSRLGEAVNYFFFLSGFVMVIAYRQVLHDKRMSSLQRSWFYWKRFARIYPMYLLAFVSFVSMQYTETGALAWNRLEFLLEMLGMQRLFFYWSMNFPAWTISVEAVFYILFPFVFPFLCRLSMAKMCAYVILFYLFSLVFNVLWGHFLVDRPMLGGGMESIGLTIFNHPLLKLAIFMLGNGCGILFLSYARQGMFLQYMILPVFFLICYLLWLLPKDDNWIQSGLLCPLYFLLVWGLCVQPKTANRAFGNRFCVFLGHISYGVYILQVPVFLFFNQLMGYKKKSLPMNEFIPYMTMLVLVSSLLYVLYERPLKGLILKKVRARYDL